jgi:hypothetical protein
MASNKTPGMHFELGTHITKGNRVQIAYADVCTVVLFRCDE